jgi:hypothetical protein
MTVETNSTFPSSSETAKAALRSMLSPDLSHAPSSQRLVLPEAEAPPQEAPPVRWPRIFPSL